MALSRKVRANLRREYRVFEEATLSRAKTHGRFHVYGLGLEGIQDRVPGPAEVVKMDHRQVAEVYRESRVMWLDLSRGPRLELKHDHLSAWLGRVYGARSSGLACDGPPRIDYSLAPPVCNFTYN